MLFLNHRRKWPLLFRSSHDRSHLVFRFNGERWITIIIIIVVTAGCFLSVNGVELVEIRASFRILGSFLAAFFNLLVVFINVLPFLFASFSIPVVSKLLHRRRYLLP